MTDVLNRLKLEGIATIRTYDRNENLLDVQTVRNVVVKTGFQGIFKKLNGAFSPNLTQFKIGTGSTTPTVNDTDVETGVNFSTGVPLKAVTSVTYPATDEMEYTLTVDFSEANGNSITEACMFFSDDTTMFSRFIFAAKNKTSQVKIIITYKVRRA